MRHHRAEYIPLERRIDALANPIEQRLDTGDLPLAHDRQHSRHHEILLGLVDDDAGSLLE